MAQQSIMSLAAQIHMQMEMEEEERLELQRKQDHQDLEKAKKILYEELPIKLAKAMFEESRGHSDNGISVMSVGDAGSLEELVGVARYTYRELHEQGFTCKISIDCSGNFTVNNTLIAYHP